jgi:glyoxylase-like metal-dependent hydrolase (beta-lactamase superfamily II)
MSLHRVVAGLHRLPLGGVNAYLLDTGSITVVDSGYPKRADRILTAVVSLRRTPADVGSILITHYHHDHAGSLAALRSATGGTVHVHPLDAGPIRQGTAPPRPHPNTLAATLARPFVRDHALEATVVDVELSDGQELPDAGGLRVIHSPGHTPGHVSLLWPERGGVLIVGDAAANVLRLGPAFTDEDRVRAAASFRRLAQLEFEAAVFGHGRPITGQANARFRRFVEAHA